MSEFLEEITTRFGFILATSPSLANDNWDFHIIINHRAGAFSRRSGQRSFIKRLDAALGGQLPSASFGEPLSLPHVHTTDSIGHASLIAVSILEASRNHGKRPFIMSIGGDGTHQETFSGIMACDPQLRSRLLAFRFPAGTGNDAADAWNVEQAVSALIEGCPVTTIGAVEFNAPGHERRYSFNIASVGIDAYVVHLTNKLKNLLPGDFYKPLTDIGVLFYELIHGIHRMTVDIYRHETAIYRLERKNGIVALGVSGWRTYGSEKWVLPGEENLCAIEKGGLFRNLQIKRHLFKASHPSLPYTFMTQTNRVVIAYPGRIPLQLDGEVLWLNSDDFPMELKIVDTGIKVLSAKQSAKQRAYTHEYFRATR